MTEILGLVSPYLSQVKRSGGDNIVALCPLHDERSPSFSFNVRNGLWRCFGCHKKGNLYTFLRDVAGLTGAELAQYKSAPANAQVHGRSRSGSLQQVEPSPDEALDDKFLERFYFCPQLLIDEGYPEDLLQQFDVGFDHAHQRITFPCGTSRATSSASPAAPSSVTRVGTSSTTASTCSGACSNEASRRALCSGTSIEWRRAPARSHTSQGSTAKRRPGASSSSPRATRRCCAWRRPALAITPSAFSARICPSSSSRCSPPSAGPST